MGKVRLVIDEIGHTLTVWIDDPTREHVCEETVEEVIMMKDAAGRIIGFEMLHFHPEAASGQIAVETIFQPAV